MLHKELRFWERTATPVAAWFVERQARLGDAARGRIALGDIGEVGYTTDYPIVDLLGLVDPVIAAEPGGYTNKTGQGYVNRFFDLEPRYVVIITDDNACTHPVHATSTVLFYDMRFRARYRLAHSIDVDSWGWCIFEHQRHAPRLETDGSTFR